MVADWRSKLADSNRRGGGSSSVTPVNTKGSYEERTSTFNDLGRDFDMGASVIDQRWSEWWQDNRERWAGANEIFRSDAGIGRKAWSAASNTVSSFMGTIGAAMRTGPDVILTTARDVGELAGRPIGNLFRGPSSGAPTPGQQEQLTHQIAAEEARLQDQTQRENQLEAYAENLPANKRAEVNVIRQQMADERKTIEERLAVLNEQRKVYDAYTDRQSESLFGPDGVLPGADDETLAELDRVLNVRDERGMLGQEVLAVVEKIWANQTLSDNEKMDRTEFVMDKAEFNEKMTAEIYDLGRNRDDLEELVNMSDSDLLANAGAYESTTINVNLIGDPATLLEESLGAAQQAMIPDLEFMALPDEFKNGMLMVYEQLMLNAVSPTTGRINLDVMENFDYTDLAALSGGRLSADQLEAWINNSLVNATVQQNMWVNALSQARYVPGSDMLAAAIYQIAEPLWGAQEANKLAQSYDVHRIIELKSQGAPGGRQSPGGTQYGLGGLSLDAYRRIWGVNDPMEMLGNPQAELEALLKYMMEFGTPAEAMASYLRSGEWGR